VAVPEERHALAKWRRCAENVVEPPLLEQRDGEPSSWSARGGEHRGLDWLRFEQTVDSLLEPVGQSGLELRSRISETRSAQHLHDARSL
jgi:hypothetical protein